jgi:hypothetical protein
MNPLAESIARVVLGLIIGAIALSLFGWVFILAQLFA